jgi:uncharacterized protein with PQ loop repeat
MIELIGTIGAIMLALCGLPQAIASIKQGHSDGISTSFIALWLVGEILLIIYVGATNPDFILMANYAFNIVPVGIIAFYKLFRRNKQS